MSTSRIASVALLLAAASCAGDSGRSSAALSAWDPTGPMSARVVSNDPGCTVDAVCKLGLELSDTVIVVAYGLGERPDPGCPIDVRVSGLAFELGPGDEVRVEVSPCGAAGIVIRSLARRGGPGS